MYILDSDTLTLYVHHQGQQTPLVHKVQSIDSSLLFVSMITVNEMVSSLVERITTDARRSHDEKMSDCRLLRDVMRGIAAFQILPYTEQAKGIFERMPSATKRLGPQDCKIAAIARAFDYTVVTRNLAHFSQIGAVCGVACEDWTKKSE